ncbi:MAG: hypothetical protein QNJ71_11370 [Acidimicrobiia bacterium]|nr:hypothetical protein [Acidimicrobiia bacterium]
MNTLHESRSRRYAWILIALAILLLLLLAVRAAGSSIEAAPEASTTTSTTDGPGTTTTVPGAAIDNPTSTSTPPPVESEERAPVAAAPMSTTTTTITSAVKPVSGTISTTTVPETTTTVPETTTTVPETTTTTVPETTQEPIPTATITVSLVTADSAPLAGGSVTVSSGEQAVPIGATDDTGTVTTDVVAGRYLVTIEYDGSTASESIEVVDQAVRVEFVTGRLQVTFSGQASVGRQPYTEPRDLLPGTYELSFFDDERPVRTADVIVEAGSEQHVTGIYATLSDSRGAGVAHGTLSVLEDGGWSVIGTTDDEGILLRLVEGPTTENLSLQMQAPGGGAATLEQDPAANSFFDFATQAGVASLVDSEGSPLAGGRLSILSNERWHDVGATGASGTVSFEAFPGSYSIAMAYNGTREQRNDVDPFTRNRPFQTGRLTLQFSGTTEWGSDSLQVYDGPEQVLPGSYVVRLSGEGRPAVMDSIDVEAGSDATATGVYVTVLDADGDPVEGAQARLRMSGSPSLGTTDERGVTASLVEGLLSGRKRVEATVNGTTARLRQDIATNSFYDFRTMTGTVEVLSYTGDAVEGVEVLQKTKAWSPIGTTDESGTVRFEVFPGTKRTYRVTHAESTASRAHRFSLERNTLTFQSMLASVAVVDGAGDPIEGLEVLAKHKKWVPAGTTDATGSVTFEIFPGTKRSHRVSINGTTATRNHKFTESKPTVTFQTTTATVSVKDSEGSPLVGVAVDQKAGKWRTVGTTDESGTVVFEAFPTNRRYRVTVGGTTAAKSHKFTAEKDTLAFQTIAATIHLRTRDGQPLPGVEVQQKSNGWVTIGTSDRAGNVTIELFAKKGRAYRATVEEVTKQKSKKFTESNSTLELVFPNSVGQEPEEFDAAEELQEIP